MVYQDEIGLSTSGHGDIHNITDLVREVVQTSGITTGLVHIFLVGSTGVVGSIEFEPGLQRDLTEQLDRLLPPSRQYGHEQMWHDGNGHSHLQATILGPDLTVPVAEGDCVLGSWQQVFMLECDNKPRERRLVITVMGQ